MRTGTRDASGEFHNMHSDSNRTVTSERRFRLPLANEAEPRMLCTVLSVVHFAQAAVAGLFLAVLIGDVVSSAIGRGNAQATAGGTSILVFLVVANSVIAVGLQRRSVNVVMGAVMIYGCIALQALFLPPLSVFMLGSSLLYMSAFIVQWRRFRISAAHRTPS